MAFLPETPSWDQVPVLANTDRVIGYDSVSGEPSLSNIGRANEQAWHLNNRLNWLREQTDTLRLDLTTLNTTVNTLSNAVVRLTGNQTIAGIKTFTELLRARSVEQPIIGEPLITGGIQVDEVPQFQPPPLGWVGGSIRMHHAGIDIEPVSGAIPFTGLRIRSNNISGLAAPTAPAHAANKQYVDSSLPYTFVIDSNAALQAWANNTSLSTNDYSRILIKAGTWTLTLNRTTGTVENPTPIINISGQTINGAPSSNTRSVLGEAGSSLVLNSNTAAASGICGIRGRTTDAHLYSFHNVVLEGNVRTDFFNCANLTNCSGSGGSSTGSDPALGGAGFSNCINLINCYGYGLGNANSSGFHTCTNLTNCTSLASPLSGAGFFNCVNLTNCSAVTTNNRPVIFSGCIRLTNCTGHGDGTSPGNNGYGFLDCTNLTNCIGRGSEITSTGRAFANCRTGFGNRGTMTDCNMNQLTTGTQTAWAHNANGGWNLSDPL